MASYVYGNTAPKHVQDPTTKQRKARAKSKSASMNKGYVAFLAIAAAITLFACVQYLQLQSEITKRSKNITTLQQQLADVKEENTTRYNAIMNAMNLEEIRDIAVNEFGMVYAEAEQIIKYQSPEGNAIVQYTKIPESGIVASSDSVE